MNVDLRHVLAETDRRWHGDQDRRVKQLNTWRVSLAQARRSQFVARIEGRYGLDR
jgi:hypothetical protein